MPGHLQLLVREDRVWMDESFDHSLRHEAELEREIDYLRQNPVEDHLVSRLDDYNGCC